MQIFLLNQIQHLHFSAFQTRWGMNEGDNVTALQIQTYFHVILHSY